MSPLGFVAVGIYVVTALTAMAAAMTASGRGQLAWHGKSWWLLAAIFAALIAIRLAGLEDLLREALRDTLRASAGYEGRRAIQQPIVTGLVGLAAAAAIWWLYRMARGARGRRNLATLAALAGGAGMVFLVPLRIISLHAVDSLLYGPLKLNWLLDIGASCLVAGAAIYYVRIVRGRRQP